MPQRKFFVATGILVFDFELFIGALRQKKEELTTLSSCPLLNIPSFLLDSEIDFYF